MNTKNKDFTSKTRQSELQTMARHDAGIRYRIRAYTNGHLDTERTVFSCHLSDTIKDFEGYDCIEVSKL